MSIRLLAAALAVVAVPVAVLAQQPAPETKAKAKAERRYCVVDNDPAGRLRSSVRRCYTKAERDEMRQEARKTIEIIQTRRASY